MCRTRIPHLIARSWHTTPVVIWMDVGLVLFGYKILWFWETDGLGAFPTLDIILMKILVSPTLEKTCELQLMPLAGPHIVLIFALP